MNAETLLKVLTQARYKILVAIRPLASAKLGFDMVVAELVSELHKQGIDRTTIDAIENLKFND